MSIVRVFKHRAWIVVWQFFVRSFILIGLPLLGWGLDDLAGFFSSPVRTSFVIVALVQVLINAWLVYRLPPEAKQDQRFEPFHLHADMIEMIFFLAAHGDRRTLLAWNENLPFGWVGLSIYLIGLSLSVWANFTWVTHVRRDGDRACANPVLLHEGPFRWIRYPALLCLVFYGLGFSIMFRSWLGLTLVLPLIGVILNRIKVLEKEHAEQYPKVWPERYSTSRRIIPFVY